MIVRRYTAHISNLVRRQINDYCLLEPDFARIWPLIIWKLEMGQADGTMSEHREGRYTATVIHSPRFPIVTLYLRFPEREIIEVYDVTLHSVH